jgi:pyruvate-formate lyase-activating enzyme
MKIFNAGCIEKIYSVSILVGSGTCDAKCKHCAATYLRKDSNNKGTTKNLKQALRLCRHYGGWSLSLTSTGEPTLSPNAITETLEAIYELRSEGTVFTNINLFTNGFEIARNPDFKNKWLPLWKSLGLTAIAVSLHHTHYDLNIIPYNVEPNRSKYPHYKETIDIIKEVGLIPRVTLLLNKGYIDNVKDYNKAINTLIDDYGVYMITSWPILSFDGKRIENTPSRWNLFKIKLFLRFSKHTKLTMGHTWGGSVNGFKSNKGNWGSVRLTNYVSKHSPKNDFVRQLVLFQDGTLSYSWYQPDAICIK